MVDRPSLQELIEAVQMHLETNVVPAVRHDRKLYFQTLVAVNVLKIAQREMLTGYDHAVAEWESLNRVEGTSTPHPVRLLDLQQALEDRNKQFARAIRLGDYDAVDSAQRILKHLKDTTTAQLEIANPKLLETLDGEDSAQS